MRLKIDGRGLRSGVVSINPTAGGISIRIDDNGNPEFWVLVELPLNQLKDLVKSCDTMRLEEIKPEGGTRD